MTRDENPFSLTKSNELTDDQIGGFWVPMAGGDDASVLMRASSRMPMFIMGGKGSGKSHLLRYYSFPLQRRRAKALGKTLTETLVVDKYIGLYSRCGTLDQDRFEGRGEDQDRWRNLFAYYFELWFGDKVLEAIQLLAEESTCDDVQSTLGALFVSLLDAPSPGRQLDSLAACREYLAALRKEVDFAINNAAFGGRVEATIHLSRGRILFDLPELVLPLLFPDGRAAPIFSYFLDEYESLDTDKQRYINTLVREKRGPTSLKIGTRLYGIKTRETFSGGESIREGSEFEELKLDERARSNKVRYERFAQQMAEKRVVGSERKATGILSELFSSYSTPAKVTFVKSRIETPTWPHNLRFFQKLSVGTAKKLAPGVTTEIDAKHVAGLLRFKDEPLLEKLLHLYVYQHWFRNEDLVEAAVRVNHLARGYLDGDRSNKFAEFVRKHTADMLAQLLRENDRPQVYAGVGDFLRMSEGLPRSLLNLLKHSYDWAIYYGERPFQRDKVSVEAQRKGVIEAADWFFEDLHLHGERRRRVQSAVSRIAQLFRINRFADKPIETSMVAFSLDRTQLSETAAIVLGLALDASLLVRLPGGQRERNSANVSSKFELNLILSPKWDLPIARRGVATLNATEAEAIFNHDLETDFAEVARHWERKMTAPEFGKAHQRRQSVQEDFFS